MEDSPPPKKMFAYLNLNLFHIYSIIDYTGRIQFNWMCDINKEKYIASKLKNYI